VQNPINNNYNSGFPQQPVNKSMGNNLFQGTNNNMTTSITVPGNNVFQNNQPTSGGFGPNTNLTTSITVPGSNVFQNKPNPSYPTNNNNPPQNQFPTYPNNQNFTTPTPQGPGGYNSNQNQNYPSTHLQPSNNVPNYSTNMTPHPTTQNQFQSISPISSKQQVAVPTTTQSKTAVKDKKKDPAYIHKVEKAKEFAKKGVAELDYKRIKQAKENLLEALKLVEELDQD